MQKRFYLSMCLLYSAYCWQPVPVLGPTGPVGVAAPGAPASDAAVVPGGELPVPRNETIYMEDSATFRIFDSFNRFIPNGNDFANGFLQIGMEYLFYANFATGEIQPWLATDYKYNDDFTELTINLRDGVKWNDGEAFTADDVVFTVNMVKGNPALSFGATMQEFVENVEAIDEKTVFFTLTKPALVSTITSLLKLQTLRQFPNIFGRVKIR
ncbi:MAG: ABC transporter substrate-binding protein [Caldilineaceae bacterium]